MLTRFFDTLRGRPTSQPAGATANGAPRFGGAGRGTTRPRRAWRGTTPRDPALPHPSTMVEAWRQDVARTVLVLRERYPAPPRDAARAQAERLLVRLAVDLDVIVRQPPPAAQDALAVAAAPECDLPRLVRAVERDPTLTRGLMRHASSALFAPASPPASIDDAVQRLGATGVQVAVLAGMAEALVARGCGPYSPAAEHVWAHMVRVGPIAGALAPAFDVPSHDGFLIGLLHDIGQLMLFDLVGAVGAELGRAVDLPDALAADALRELHAPLGGLALIRWGVDPRAAWAVAHHRRCLPPADPDPRSELAYVAERLDRALTTGQTPALDQWFADGQLTASRERVGAAVARVRDVGVVNCRNCGNGAGRPRASSAEALG